MKAKERNKQYKAALRQLAAEGIGFDAEGKKRPFPSDSRMSQHLQAGYKVGVGSFRRRRTSDRD